MRKVLNHIILTAIVLAYVYAVFAGQIETAKRVFYSTSAPRSFGKGENKPTPLDIRPLWTYKSQITSSYKIQAPDEGLPTTIIYPVFTEFIIEHTDIPLPKNLQPLSFPSKPRDPPAA